MKGNDLACPGVHGDPDPLLVGFLLDEAAHFIRFDVQALDHHVLYIRDRLDMEMIRQGLNAVDQKPSEPLECDPHRATHAAQRNPFQQQAFDKSPSLIRDEILFEALDKLASTAVAVMILFAVVNVPVFLKLGGLAPRTDVSDDHGVLLTSVGWRRVFGQP
jgi:hypothetical protein